MNDNKDNLEFIDEIKVQIQESKEEFIYTMISPFCETIMEKKLNKKELEKILRKGMQKSIPLDKVKKVREKIFENVYRYSGSGEEVIQGYCDGFKACLKILDKLIESEE